MTDRATISPYQAFLNQTLEGDSRIWTWLVGIWFAITIWFYGQLIFSIPMTIAAIASEPGGMDAFRASFPQEQGNTSVLPVVSVALSFPLISLLIWAIKDGIPQRLSKLGIVIAAFFAAGSVAGKIFIGGNSFLFGAALFSIVAGLFIFVRETVSQSERKIFLALAALFAVTSFAAIIYSAILSSGSSQGELINTWLARSPLVYLFMLLMFPPFALALWAVQRKIHKRTILSLHTAASRFRWKRLFFSMVVFWAVAGIMSYIGHSTGTSEAEFVFDPSKFWKYLPITLLFIPLQSATEEIALRGYLNQGLGHYIKNPLVIFIITSAAFASLHLGNPEVAEGTAQTSKLMAVSGYFLFGMFACLLTYIDGGLETAIGVHAANNIFAAAFVGYESSALPTPTVFRVGLNTEVDTYTTVIALSIVCAIMYVTRKALD